MIAVFEESFQIKLLDHLLISKYLFKVYHHLRISNIVGNESARSRTFQKRIFDIRVIDINTLE